MALNFLNDGYFAGKVGIGTNSPGGKLDVSYTGTGGTGTFGIGEGLNIASFSPNITFNDNSTSVDNYAIHLNQSVFTIGRYTSSTSQSPDLVLKSGNVGIGTTSPNHKLDIYSNENVPLRIHRPNNANLDSAGAWGIGFSTRGDAVTSTTDTRSGIFSYYNGNLFLATNNTRIDLDPDSYARLTILAGGNVGIGTTSPSAKLHVVAPNGTNVGSGNFNFILDAQDVNSVDSNGLLVKGGADSSAGTTFAIQDYSGNTDFMVNGAGNVGIGTTSPGAKLHLVSGTGVPYSLRLNSDATGTWQLGVGSTGYYDGSFLLQDASVGDRLRINSSGTFTLPAYDSTNQTGTPTYILGTTSSGDIVKVLGGNIPIAAPAAPSTVTSTIVGETIEITFNQSSTSNIDYYQVWSSDDGGDYGIIGQIAPVDFSSTMTVVDTTFVTGGTMSYRVYAVKTGIYSSAATTSKTYTVSALSVTAMTVVNLNTAYYIQYEKPASRFIDHIEIYMDSQTTLAALNRNNASIVYSGQNASYMRNVNTSNNFHQFWVEVVTT